VSLLCLLMSAETVEMKRFEGYVYLEEVRLL
jgi:hypothetical protein